jgi:hypothetical protein
MNESIADSSASNVNSPANPPDWFLKRRARLDDLTRQRELAEHDAEQSAQPQQPFDLDVTSDPGSDNTSELSEFTAILRQAGLASSDTQSDVAQPAVSQTEASQVETSRSTVPWLAAAHPVESRLPQPQPPAAKSSLPKQDLPKPEITSQPAAKQYIFGSSAAPVRQLPIPPIPPPPRRTPAVETRRETTTGSKNTPAAGLNSVTQPDTLSASVSHPQIETTANGNPRLQTNSDPTQTTPDESKPKLIVEKESPAQESAQQESGALADETESAFQIDLNVAAPASPRPVRRVVASLIPLPDAIEFGSTEAAAPDAEGYQSVELTVEVAPKPKAAVAKVKSVPEDERSAFQRFTHRWFGTDAIGSYTISVVLHLIVALLLSLLAFRKELQEATFTTLMAQTLDAPGEEQLDDTLVSVDISGGQTGQADQDILSVSSVASVVPLSTSSISDGLEPDAIMKSGEGQGTGNGIGDGLNIGGYQMPEGGKAVKKGSFTVWTVPADPAPYEAYKIIIQVQYKKPGQKLLQSDISGMVRGTDKWERMISEKTTTIIPEANQIVLEIPGAKYKVRDTINVQSRLLGESQRIQIVF